MSIIDPRNCHKMSAKRWIEKKTSSLVFLFSGWLGSERIRAALSILRRRTPLPAFEFTGKMELVAVPETESRFLDGKFRILQQIFRGLHSPPENIFSRRTVQMVAKKTHKRGTADMKQVRRPFQQLRGIQMRLHETLRLLKQNGPLRSRTRQYGTGNQKLLGLSHDPGNIDTAPRLQQPADFPEPPDRPRRIGQRIHAEPVQIQGRRHKIQLSSTEFQHELPICSAGRI